MKYTFTWLVVLIIITGCHKEQTITASPTAVTASPETFTEYKIAAGEHYCDKTSVTPVSVTAMFFKVRFDSSAIYTSTDPANQYDINKLYGFTEGMDPHINSARIGWGFSDGKLRLYAYAYNNKQRLSREISAVNINDTITCAIKLDGFKYIFSVNDKQVELSRHQAGTTASGYQLFPYFGGDEVAPHLIRILISEIKD